jgi:hypothetical protein
MGEKTLTPELAQTVAKTLTDGVGVTGVTIQAWEDIGSLIGENGGIVTHRYVLVISAASAPLPEPAWSMVDADTRGVFEAMRYVARAYDEAVRHQGADHA